MRYSEEMVQFNYDNDVNPIYEYEQLKQTLNELSGWIGRPADKRVVDKFEKIKGHD